MGIETKFSPITHCPSVGDRVFIDDKGLLRPAKVEFVEAEGLIEFTFEDDDVSWSLVAVLPNGFNPLIFKSN